MNNYFNIQKEIPVSCGKIYRTVDELIVFHPLSNLNTQNLNELKENRRAYVELLGGEKLPFITDISDVNNMGTEEKNYIRNSVGIFSSVAFVTNKSVSKVLLNLFLVFYRQEPQIKMFSTLDEAANWSLQNYSSNLDKL